MGFQHVVETIRRLHRVLKTIDDILNVDDSDADSTSTISADGLPSEIDASPSRVRLDDKTKKRYRRGIQTLNAKILQLRDSQTNVIKRYNKSLEKETEGTEITKLKNTLKKVKGLQEKDNRLADKLTAKRRELQRKLENG